MLAKLIIITCFLINPLEIFEYLPPVYKTYRFSSKSMHPTIQSGEYILADLQAYIESKPQRGKLIIFKSPQDNSIHFIKRIVGLEGDTIKIEGEKLFINNQLVKEEYAFFDKDVPAYDTNIGPLQIPPGMVFVLGDNRRKSMDSRSFGHIKLEDIIGQAILIFWSDDPTRRWKKVD